MVKAVEDWYDTPDRMSSTVDTLPSVLPLALNGAPAKQTDFFDDPVSRLDMSKFPSKNAGLPVDIDVVNILAGGDGIASKPDILTIGAQLVTDVQELAAALAQAFGGNITPLQTWISEHLDLSWLPDLSSWVGVGLGAIQTMLNQIADILRGLIVTPINTAVQGVKDWFLGLLGWQSDTDTSVSSVTSTAAAVSAQVVTIQQVFAVRSNRPLWEGLDPTGESTFPYALLAKPTAHTHAYNAGEDGSASDTTGSAGVSELLVNGTRSVCGCIRSEAPTEKKQITFLARRSGTVVGFYLDVYTMDDDGSFVLVHSTADLSGDLTTVTTWAQVEIPAMLTELGDVVMVQFRAGGTVYVAGIELPAPSNPFSFRPLATGLVRDGTAPSTIATSAADLASSGQTPYVQIGSDVGQLNAPRNFLDAFNRASLGANWALFTTSGIGSPLALSSNRLVNPSSLTALYSRACGLYTLPLVSDEIAVEFDLTSSTNVYSCALMCASSSLTNVVQIAVKQDRVGIWTLPGIGSDPYEQAAVATSGVATRWIATCTEDTPGTWTYRVYKTTRTAPIVSWTDTGHTISHGKGKRFVGAEIDNYVFAQGSPIDNWHAYDITD